MKMVDYGPNGSYNRFVCPSDRQLALRAKLKTGWSVKTGSMGYGSSTEHTGNGGGGDGGDQAQATAPNAAIVRQPLAPEEQEQILEVIRRAEALDLREQERVGRLVARLENMKRNALGRLPNQCLLCADHFGLLGAQSVRCIYCRKLVCQKCAIENYETNAHRRNEWLCKICAETREMWKKSGAWFYNQLPRYILPGQKRQEGPGDRSRNSPAPDDSSSSEDERRIAAMTRRSRRSSKDEERVHTPTPQESYSRQTSSSESRSSGKEPGTSGLAQNSLETIDGIDETHGSIAGSRRGSTASRSLSDWTWSEDKTSPSVSSVVSSGIGGNRISEEHSPKNLDPNTPTICLTLSYDPLTDTLHVLVHRAKNLPPMDINGLADPFCKLDIVPEGKICRRLRTKTVHKTRNPEFDESLTFYEITEMDLLRKSLHVLVLDDDKYGKDYMGEAKISLAGLKVQRSLSATLSLEKQVNGDCIGPNADLSYDDRCSRGQILISLCYSTRRRALLVTIVRCANLLPMDNNGFSDPFVKLHLQPHHRKYKTTIKWKNLNPTFNEEFPFETRPDELSTQSLYISVWDKDYGKSNDYLGGLIIGGVGSKGRRLKHWLDMIHYPDHRHECWHNLIEDQLPD